MRGRGWSIVGVILAVAGAVFTLQGIGLLGGSFMSGSATWAIAGPLIAVAGVVIYRLAR